MTERHVAPRSMRIGKAIAAEVAKSGDLRYGKPLRARAVVWNMGASVLPAQVSDRAVNKPSPSLGWTRRLHNRSFVWFAKGKVLMDGRDL